MTAREFQLPRPRSSTYGWLLFALSLFLGSAVQARNWNVQAGGSRLEFVPRELTIAPGDTVTWSNLGGHHNVFADNGAFRCANGCDGLGGNGSPSAQIWRATLSFPQAGRFGYFCEPHGQPGAGMYGTINVVGAPVVPVPVDGWQLGTLLSGLLLASALLWMRRRTAEARESRTKQRHVGHESRPT